MDTNLPAVREDPTASDDEIRELESADLPDDDDDDVIEQPDGSAIIISKSTASKKRAVTEHDENLVEILDESFLNQLGEDLAELIEQDIENRKERDKQYSEGIKRTGLTGQAPGGADFDGASRVTHPMLAKGCVDFASKAIKELFPAGGPCKTQIIGKQTDEKITRAERKRTYINWQLTTRVSENRSEFERLLSQLPLGGACYKRWWRDEKQKRLRTETVFIDDMFIPYNCSDFYSAYRATHRQYISRQEFESRIESGLYVDPGTGSPPTAIDDKSQSREASETVEGVEEDSAAYSDEGNRKIYMAFADIDGENNGDCAPYIIHIDAWSKKVLGLYRNWEEDDKNRQRLDWFAEYIFIPWRGPQGIGLNHLIGSMAAASTGALRALLDSAHIQNFPGGLKLKSGRTAGQSVKINATQLAEIDAPAGTDDIRKLVMPFPFNGPSTVLYTLLEWLTQQAETVVATANEKIADGGTNMPVGTALALIEQGSVNFSAIHARLHASLKKELAIVHRLDAKYMDDQETVAELGEMVVYRKDFEGPVDVIPVSDPNIFSESQRFAQLQAVMQLAQTPSFAQFFRPDKLLRRALKLLQVSDPEDMASLPPEPQNIDAIEENYVITLDEPLPLKVYDNQDDYEHLLSHTHFLSSPMFGANPLIAPLVLPKLLPHCKNHLMSLYRKHCRAAAEVVKQVSWHVHHKKIEDHVAHARGAAFADQVLANLLGPQIMPALQAAMQMAKAMMPPPQGDPNKMAEIAAKRADAEADRQQQMTIETNKLNYQREKDTADRAANQSAAQMAAASEAQATAATVQLQREKEFAARQMEILKTHLAALQKSMDAQTEQAKAQVTADQQNFLQMLKDQGAQQLAALEYIFGVNTAAAAPTTEKGPDGETSSTPGQVPAGTPPVAGIVQALLETINENNSMIASRLGEHSGMFEQLARGMQSLSEAQNAPRKAEFITDDSGKKVGVRSTIERNQQ